MMFKSRVTIGDSVNFIPSDKDCDNCGIRRNTRLYGSVIAVRFTRAKVLYDCLDDTFGVLCTNVDSCNVCVYDNNSESPVVSNTIDNFS